MPSAAWLPAHRKLLGVLSDEEVARRAGVAQATVTRTRTALGIPSKRSRGLADIAPAEVLRLVRARARAGKPMTQAAVHGLRLSTLCSYHFGGWYQAVEAAGLRPLGQARSATTRPAGPRPLTEALLRSDKPALELERLTAVPRETIRFRRAKLGIVRSERRRREDLIKPVRRLLGKLPDSEVARRAGLSPSTVFKARQQLAIPRAPLPSKATSSGLRERLQAMPKAELRRLLAGLKPADAELLRMRYLEARPMTLAEVGRRLGVTRQAVAIREERVVAAVIGQLHTSF